MISGYSQISPDSIKKKQQLSSLIRIKKSEMQQVLEDDLSESEVFKDKPNKLNFQASYTPSINWNESPEKQVQ